MSEFKMNMFLNIFKKLCIINVSTSLQIDIQSLGVIEKHCVTNVPFTSFCDPNVNKTFEFIKYITRTKINPTILTTFCLK